MTAVTTLPYGRALTRADLDSMPDDGHRYELIDGLLIVSPAPVPLHQVVVANLIVVLRAARRDDTQVVLPAPVDVVLADDSVLQPDVLVARAADFSPTQLAVAPLLAVEVLSPSTRRFDLLSKRSRYESAGCLSYWVIDPDVPSLIAWELRDAAYVEVARVSGDAEFCAQLPFPVTIAPSTLVHFHR